MLFRHQKTKCYRYLLVKLQITWRWLEFTCFRKYIDTMKLCKHQNKLIGFGRQTMSIFSFHQDLTPCSIQLHIFREPRSCFSSQTVIPHHLQSSTTCFLHCTPYRFHIFQNLWIVPGWDLLTLSSVLIYILSSPFSDLIHVIRALLSQRSSEIIIRHSLLKGDNHYFWSKFGTLHYTIDGQTRLFSNVRPNLCYSSHIICSYHNTQESMLNFMLP